MAKTKSGQNKPTVIKKYANRRLYDTGRSSYVTLDDLCDLVKEGHEFVVQEAKSGKDITRSVLTQIIVEQESREDQNLLPTGFLRNLIAFYGDNIQSLVPNYLETTLDLFVKNQENLREQVNKSIEGMSQMSPMGQMKNVGVFPGAPQLEEMSRQNMQMFQRTMKMFSPFNMPYGPNGTAEEKDSGSGSSKSSGSSAEEASGLSS